MYVGRIQISKLAFHAAWVADGRPLLQERDGRIFYVDEDRNQIMLNTFFAEGDAPSVRISGELSLGDIEA